jgi:hypothetical protein
MKYSTLFAQFRRPDDKSIIYQVITRKLVPRGRGEKLNVGASFVGAGVRLCGQGFGLLKQELWLELWTAQPFSVGSQNLIIEPDVVGIEDLAPNAATLLAEKDFEA